MVLLTIQTAEELGLDYDLTIVDDGSAPHTADLLRALERHFPDVCIVRHEKNRGYGGALRSGFSAASKDWIFYTDGDAQYDVRELAKLIEHAGPDVDVVQGYKIERHDPLHRIIIGRIIRRHTCRLTQPSFCFLRVHFAKLNRHQVLGPPIAES